jgi:altronate hydrolase
MKHLMKMNPRDTVAVALRPLSAGEQLTIDSLTLQAAQDIPQGHKIALTDFQTDEVITKYGLSYRPCHRSDCRRGLDSYA